MKHLGALSAWLSTTCEQITMEAIDIAILEAAGRQREAGGLRPTDIHGIVQKFVTGQISQVMAQSPPELRFLPIIHLESGAFIAHEAVVHCEPSMDDMSRRRVGGAAVLRSDLELGVLRATMQELEHLNDATFVCFDISHQLLADSRLDQLIAEFGGDRLVLEINAKTPEADFASLRIDLDRLRRRGIRVAINDIGVGTVGLERIGAFEPEIIKIDVSANQRLGRDAARREQVSEAVQFARQHGAFVIAEGIESSEQITVAQDLGVDAGQGILLGMS